MIQYVPGVLYRWNRPSISSSDIPVNPCLKGKTESLSHKKDSCVSASETEALKLTRILLFHFIFLQALLIYSFLEIRDNIWIHLVGTQNLKYYCIFIFTLIQSWIIVILNFFTKPLLYQWKFGSSSKIYLVLEINRLHLKFCNCLTSIISGTVDVSNLPWDQLCFV